MDNRGTPAPSNSQIRQNRDAVFPNRRGTQNVEDHEPALRRITREAEIAVHENNQVEVTNESDDDAGYEEAERLRKGKMPVSAYKAEPKRKGRVAAPEIPSGLVIRDHEGNHESERESESDSEDAEYQRQLNVTRLESLKTQNVEAPEQSESESDSEDDAEYQRQLHLAKLESLKTQNVEAPEPFEAEPGRKGKVAEHDTLGAEYERQLSVAIEESLKSYHNNSAGRSLDEHTLRTETRLARGNIGNDSMSNPAMDLANVSDFPNEDRVDEGAQTETLDAVRGNESPKVKHAQPLKSLNGKRKIRAKKPKLAEPDMAGGKFINSPNDTEPTGSLPHQRVSSRGRLLKPTSKLLEVSNVTHAPAGEGTSGSERKEPKKHRLSNVIGQARSLPRIPVGVVNGPEDAPLPMNRRSRHSFRQYGSQHNRLQSSLAGVSEGPGSVVTQAGQVNGVAQADVVNPDGSGVGSEDGGSEPDADYWIPDVIVVPFFDPTSVAGQASEANAVGWKKDMVVPLPEPMVCDKPTPNAPHN